MSNTGRLDIDEDLVDVEMRVERRFVHSMFGCCLTMEGYLAVAMAILIHNPHCHGVPDVVSLQKRLDHLYQM